MRSRDIKIPPSFIKKTNRKGTLPPTFPRRLCKYFVFFFHSLFTLVSAIKCILSVCMTYWYFLRLCIWSQAQVKGYEGQREEVGLGLERKESSRSGADATVSPYPHHDVTVHHIQDSIPHFLTTFFPVWIFAWLSPGLPRPLTRPAESPGDHRCTNIHFRWQYKKSNAGLTSLGFLYQWEIETVAIFISSLLEKKIPCIAF